MAKTSKPKIPFPQGIPPALGQRVRILGCTTHQGRHNGEVGIVGHLYQDGSISVDLGFDRSCLTSAFEVVDSDPGAVNEAVGQGARPALKRRGRPRRLAATPEPTAQPPVDEAQDPPSITHSAGKPSDEPLLSLRLAADGTVSLTYCAGSCRVEADNLSKEHLAAIIKLTKGIIGISGMDIT